MTLSDNDWTEMVNNCMDIEENKELINEELEKMLEYINNNVV